MRRLLAFVFLVPLTAATAPTALAEIITVPNTRPVSVKSKTVLDPKLRYTIVAKGRVSDWSNAPEDGFGVDAIWCYAKWRCGSGEAWRQLRVKAEGEPWGPTWGKGLDEFAGSKEPLPYQASHVYSVQVTGVQGRLEFATWDALALRSYPGNKGAFTVEIKQAGGSSAKAWPKFPDPLVSLTSVSNGCGGGIASNEPRFADTSTYLETLLKPYRVNFRVACNLHDAGYSGAKVKDPINGGIIDYYGWSQRQIDDKFLADMRKLCAQQIPASARRALARCNGNGGAASFGAKSRYDFVRFRGHKYYRARPNLRGSWSLGAVEIVFAQQARNVRGTWQNGNATGELRGTVISFDQDSWIKGFARLTANGATKTYAITIKVNPDTPNTIVATGAALHGVLTRTP